MLRTLEPKVDAALGPAFRNKDDVTQTPTALTWKHGPSAGSDHQSDTPGRPQRTPSSPGMPKVKKALFQKLGLHSSYTEGFFFFLT